MRTFISIVWMANIFSCGMIVGATCFPPPEPPALRTIYKWRTWEATHDPRWERPERPMERPPIMGKLAAATTPADKHWVEVGRWLVEPTWIQLDDGEWYKPPAPPRNYKPWEEPSFHELFWKQFDIPFDLDDSASC